MLNEKIINAKELIEFNYENNDFSRTKVLDSVIKYLDEKT